jgi:vacuolar-type H+-ATPase subunit E/Vma4
MKLKNARDKLKEAQENASKDNDKEKAKTVAKIK